MSPQKQLSLAIRKWAEVFMHRSMRDIKRVMDENNLSFLQINILMRLAHHGTAGVTAIGEHMGVTNAGASQAVDRLVQIGLIERTEDPEDRRAKRLALTTAGVAFVEKRIEARSKWLEQPTGTLTEEQQEMITTALTLLTNAMRITEE